MNICLNILFEVFMDCMENIWLSPKKIYFLTKPTQLTKQETVFPYLPPTSWQILLHLFSFGQQKGMNFSVEWYQISENVLSSTTVAFHLYFEIGLYAILQSLGLCDEGTWIWRGNHTVVRLELGLCNQTGLGSNLLFLTSHLDEFRQGTWLLQIPIFPFVK